jgi:hypothetical protein
VPEEGKGKSESKSGYLKMKCREATENYLSFKKHRDIMVFHILISINHSPQYNIEKETAVSHAPFIYFLNIVLRIRTPSP